MRFQDLFHSPPGVLFAFPSRYWFTIGRLRVFSLGGWSPHLQTGFHVSRPTCRNPSSTHQSFAYGAITHYGRTFQTVPLTRMLKLAGCSHFARHYSRESRLISVPLATEMFQFTRFALLGLCIQPRVTLAGRVSPFGHLRINARLPAPRSFSQAATSFIACNRQGIHHMHLFA